VQEKAPVQTFWMRRKLFAHIWMRTKAFVQTLWFKSGISSKFLDMKQRDLFERFGCTAGFVQTI
jgi:hypothetical protein